jgi:hypothetical protein
LKGKDLVKWSKGLFIKELNRLQDELTFSSRDFIEELQLNVLFEFSTTATLFCDCVKRENKDIQICCNFLLIFKINDVLK